MNNLEKVPLILLDPYQFSGYGGNKRAGESYICRFYSHKKLLWTSIYVPYGPASESLKGIENFLNDFSSKKLTKIKIDLPLVLDAELVNSIQTLFQNRGFKQKEYIMDDETLLLSRDNFALNKRNLRYVRQGERSHEIKVVEELTEEQLKEIYNLHIFSANRIGYRPKPIEAFKDIAQKTITSLAYSKITNKLDAFLMGYILELPDKNWSLNRNFSTILQLVFTGISEHGMKNKVGFALHNTLFTYSFEKNIKYIDFHGASRTKNVSYLGFKQNFGGEFITLPGSFEKVFIV